MFGVLLGTLQKFKESSGKETARVSSWFLTISVGYQQTVVVN